MANAEIVLAQAEYDYMINPNPTTAAALATAEANRDNSIIVRDQAADDLSTCIANNPPESQPLPIPLAINASRADTADVAGTVSVLVR